ncbi:MAG: tyrosine-type recombinase/integrase [Dehalococcoidia bacterium]|jgi:integrase/recombinase XerD
MTRVAITKDLKAHSEPQLIDRLIAAATNPRDRAFVSLLSKTGIRISEATGAKTDDIDFKNGTLTIMHLKERSKLKCPHCGVSLGKRHLFCPGCGDKVEKTIREKIEQRHQRIVPIDPNALGLLAEYLRWRQRFSYRGPLLFPFTRQRGWQLVEKLGRRIGIAGLHPHDLRHFLATTWVSKGLDIKKLQLLLGHSNISTTMEYVDSNLEQLRSECQKLWDTKENETAQFKEEE